MAWIFSGKDEVDQWNGNGKGGEPGALEHGKRICSSSSPTRCSRTKPGDKNEKNREKEKLQKPGCHKPTPLRKISSSRFGCSGNHCELTVLRNLLHLRFLLIAH